MKTKELLSRVAENMSVRRAFGTPYEKDQLLIIPVALVVGGGGGGEGKAAKPGPDNHSPESAVEAVQDDEAGSATGSGGGFGGLVLPTGVYVANGDKVRWVPAVDATLVVLASLSVVRSVIKLRTRGRRRQRPRVVHVHGPGRSRTKRHIRPNN